MFKSRIIYGNPPVDTQQTKCSYFLMLCQNHGPGVFLWHWGRVQEADAEFSRVDSRDFHTVINEQHIEEDGDSLCGWSGGPRIIGRLRQRLNGCQTACEIATHLRPRHEPINLFCHNKFRFFIHDSVWWVAPPPHPPSFFCGAKLIFRSLNVSISL